MQFLIILALVSAATCTLLQSALIRKEPKTLQLIRTAKYPEYQKLNSTERAAVVGTNLYRADYEYGQMVGIGTPPQEALVYLTTWASIIHRCQGKRNFAPDKSSTFTPSNKNWRSMSYLGGTASGVLGSDRVNIDETHFSIPKITFGLATSLEIEDGQGEADGVLGLAFVPFEGTNSDPFITSAFKEGICLDSTVDIAVSHPYQSTIARTVTQGKLEPLFTIWLKPGNIQYGEVGGVITYGSIDTANCGPVLKREKITSSTSYEYMIDGISMGSFSKKAKFVVQQDLGIWIVAPPKIVSEMAKIAKAQFYPAAGVYTIDCAAEFPDFKVTSGSTEYSIKAANLKFELEPGLCLFAFFPYQPQQGQSDFNFGLPFTRQYCTTFDIGKKQIGFAEAYLDGPRTTSTQKPTTSTQKPTTSTQQKTTPVVISTEKPGTTEQPKETTTSKKAGGIWIMQTFFISIVVFIIHHCGFAQI
ncbi:hypothetical protein Aduo_012919 [Ancylostoma duodenale]